MIKENRAFSLYHNPHFFLKLPDALNLSQKRLTETMKAPSQEEDAIPIAATPLSLEWDVREVFKQDTEKDHSLLGGDMDEIILDVLSRSDSRQKHSIGSLEFEVIPYDQGTVNDTLLQGE